MGCPKRRYRQERNGRWMDNCTASSRAGQPTFANILSPQKKWRRTKSNPLYEKGLWGCQIGKVSTVVENCDFQLKGYDSVIAHTIFFLSDFYIEIFCVWSVCDRGTAQKEETTINNTAFIRRKRLILSFVLFTGWIYAQVGRNNAYF